jgi:5-(carboxyamino)imidazole ribonucleotide mutase
MIMPVTEANGKPLVRIILGSKSDTEIGNLIKEQLEIFEIPYDIYISSAHRNPEETKNLASTAQKDGIQIIIAAAGMAAHLPGVIASYTILPVIGVPLSNSALNGQDALFAIVQMPSGIPVATVAIDGGKNAAILAAEILALSNVAIQEKVKQYRKSFLN